MRKSRWIVQTLILSVGLNVVLVGIFFYFIIRDNPLQFSYQPREKIIAEPLPIPSSFLGRLHALSFEHLLELLKDDRVVDQGYKVRDFALGALVTFFDFDLERALGRGGFSKRKWEFDETNFLLFPGLSDHDFSTIHTFALKEKWPFTTKGLFNRIAKEGIEKSDPLLLTHFCHTPEFILLETLFARTRLPIQKGAILSLALEGGWERLSTFVSRKKIACDFSDHTRQTLLVDYITGGSKTAAYLLLVTDQAFALKQLDDQQIDKLLDLLQVKTHEALDYVQNIATSPRGDQVREKAKQRRSEFLGEAQEEVVGHFVEKPGLKELRPVFREQPPAAPAPSTHIIQPGESLWLIARKYGISLEELKQINHLQSDTIQPGRTLRIP